MKLLSIILISCLGTIVYSNTFHCSFHFDDQSFIIGNNAIKDIHNLQYIWKYYPGRFITFLSIAVNYHFNGLDVFGYHLFNLIVHLITAILVWWLTLLTLSTPAMMIATTNKSRARHEARSNLAKAHRKAVPDTTFTIIPHADLIALFVGLVFVSHPIQVEAVTYIWQRAASMATLFCLASLCFYVKSGLLAFKPDTRSDSRSKSPLKVFCYIFSFIMALAAMITKEIALILPLMILLYEFTFLKDKGKLNWIRLFPFLLTIFVIPFLTLLTNSENVSYIHGSVEAPGGISAMQYVLTEFRVMVTYIRLCFLPLNQNLDYDYHISRSIFELPTLLSFLSLIIILFWAQRLFSKYRLISFSIFWFFLASLTEAIPFPIKDVIFEHRLYLALVGYSIFLVSGVYYLWGRKNITTMIIVLTMVIGCNSVLTYQRNKAWKDGITLMDDIIQKSPRKSRPYNDRGFYYDSQGQYAQAIADYTKSIELGNPVNAEPYNNRGNIYSILGKFNQALLDYNKAIEIDPDYTEAYNNRGRTYYNQHNMAQAVSDFNKSIELNPDYIEAYSNRGSAYEKLGNTAQALSDQDKVIELDPRNAHAYYDRGLIFVDQGDFIHAILDFTKAIEIDPGYADAYNNRGRIHDIQGNLLQAIADYNKAIELNPKTEIAYINRAVVYYRLKEYDKAWGDVHQAQELGATVNPGFIKDLKQASGQDQ